MKIGLTGPTGSGKSAVSVVAEELGFQVINCDIVARKATEKGSIGLLKLAAVFGEDILNPDDTLNRKALAKKAFSTKENTELLNKTLFIQTCLFLDVKKKKKIEHNSLKRHNFENSITFCAI